MLSASPSASPTGRPRSNSYTSSVKEFHVGTKVLIVETENVVQRARHLIGKIGTICEVPTHPATWFKVEFPDHPVVTFRPSAFKVIGSDSDFDGLDLLPSSATLSRLPRPYPGSKPRSKPKGIGIRMASKVLGANSRAMDFQESGGVDDDLSNDDDTITTDASLMCDQPNDNEGSNSLPFTETKHKPLILDTVDPEIWIGCIVKIIGGKNHLEEGKVARTGNGWVQVVTANGEEIAKRAHELEILTLPAGITRPTSFHRSAPSASRRKSSDGPHSNAAMYDDDRPRPRRLMKRYANGDISIKGLDYDEPKDFYYWIRELKKSIVIDENFSCQTSHRESKYNFCKECSSELWPGSKLCWNEDCIESPAYGGRILAGMSVRSFPEKCSNDLAIPSSLSPDLRIPSPVLENKSSISIPVYQSESYHDKIQNNVKKLRSDSSLTDQESASPELQALKDTFMKNTLTLPPNNRYAYEDKNSDIPYYYPHTPAIQTSIQASGVLNQLSAASLKSRQNSSGSLSIDMSASEDSKLLTAMFSSSLQSFDMNHAK